MSIYKETQTLLTSHVFSTFMILPIHNLQLLTYHYYEVLAAFIDSAS